jgi:hypothetical protein
MGEANDHDKVEKAVDMVCDALKRVTPAAAAE